MTQKEQHEMRVLLGDDQIGEIGSFQNKCFIRNYGKLANFEFENNAERFIQRAKEGKYYALIIDLNWEDSDWEREYKTGFRILDAVREYASIRILHTSDKDLIDKGYQHGATHCIEKNRSSSYLEDILKKNTQKMKGGERK